MKSPRQLEYGNFDLWFKGLNFPWCKDHASFIFQSLYLLICRFSRIEESKDGDSLKDGGDKQEENKKKETNIVFCSKNFSDILVKNLGFMAREDVFFNRFRFHGFVG